MDTIQDQYSNNDNWDKATEVDEINLLDYFRVIYKYRRMILLICAISVAAGILYSLVSPEKYSATASVVPPMEMLQEESGLAGLAGGLAAGRNSLLRQAIDVASVADMYADILHSRAVVDAIIDRFNLMEVYEEKQYKSDARSKLRQNTSVKVLDAGVVTITVEDRDPNRAASIANAYVEELDRQNKKLSSGQATSKRLFLENRLKEIERGLSNIENIPAREARIKEMLYEMLSQEYELAKIEEAKSMPTIQILDEAVVPEKKSKPRRILIVLASALVSLFAAAFMAFAREYVATMKASQAKTRWRSPAVPTQDGAEDSDFSEVEGKRKIVATQRRKRAQEEKAYSQETLIP